MTETEVDVLIVGAGASGLTLACDLRRRGVACRIVEKQLEPFPGSRGKGLQPRTLEVFDDLGIIGAITAAGGSFPPFRGRKGNTVLWDRDLATMMNLTPLTPDSSAPYTMWMVPQFATETILRSRLGTMGTSVEMGTELTSFEDEGECVRATLASADGTERLRCSYLVGCDGGHSFVRKHAGIGFVGEVGSYRSVIADVEVEGLERGYWHFWMRSQDSMDRVTLCSLPGTSLFQFSAPVGEAEMKDVSLPALQRIFEERAEGFPLRWKRLLWSTVYRLNSRLAERFRKARVLLAGDAAHVHSPFGGQGINTSIQDAYNLGWKLEATLRRGSKVLDTYEEERLPVAADVLGISSGLHRENYDRAAAAEMATANRDIYQLKLGYRGGSLGIEERLTPAEVRAGDRAPDARCALASGMPTRLFDLYRGPHWTTLHLGQRESAANSLAGFGDRVKSFNVREHPDADGAPTCIVDGEGAIARTYGVSATEELTLVIRPDGYIGMAAVGEATSRVAAYLKQAGA